MANDLTTTDETPKSSLYSDEDLGTLKFLEGLQIGTIKELTKDGISTDEDDITKLLALSKEVSANIHRKAANESKHDIGTSEAESMASMAKRAQEIQTLNAKALTENKHMLGVNEVSDEYIPTEVVPGHMDTEITRPSYKEVMSAVDEDDGDDDD